jgi:hypothetical protein
MVTLAAAVRIPSRPTKTDRQMTLYYQYALYNGVDTGYEAFLGGTNTEIVFNQQAV